MSFYKSGLVAVTAGLAGALFGFWLSKRLTSQPVDPEPDLLMDVLFFPDSDVEGVQAQTNYSQS